jgi:hypothetical protein
MPNKGLRKMQAKPLLNITKQFKTKSWAQFQISNTVIAIIKGDDAEVIGLKYKRAVAVLTTQIAVKYAELFL